MVAGVWRGVAFSNLKKFWTRISIQNFWNWTGVGIWKCDHGDHGRNFVAKYEGDSLVWNEYVHPVDAEVKFYIYCTISQSCF